MINVPKDALNPLSMENKSEVSESPLGTTDKGTSGEALTKTAKLNGEIKEKDCTSDSLKKKLSSIAEKKDSSDKNLKSNNAAPKKNINSQKDPITDKKSLSLNSDKNASEKLQKLSSSQNSLKKISLPSDKLKTQTLKCSSEKLKTQSHKNSASKIKTQSVNSSSDKLKTQSSDKNSTSKLKTQSSDKHSSETLKTQTSDKTSEKLTTQSSDKTSSEKLKTQSSDKISSEKLKTQSLDENSSEKSSDKNSSEKLAQSSTNPETKSTKENPVPNSSSSDNSETKSKETKEQNGLSNPDLSKEKGKESPDFSESKTDIPTSHDSLDLDLEEKLLEIDTDIHADDHEDFCEEKLLEESDEEFSLKDKTKEEEKTNQNKNIFEEDEHSISEKINEESSDRQEKEIEKILKNLNNSLEKSKTDVSESTTFKKRSLNSSNSGLSSDSTENSNSKLSEDDNNVSRSGNNSNSISINKPKLSDSSDSNKSSVAKRKLSDDSKTSSSKRKLSETSNSAGCSRLENRKPSKSNEEDSNKGKKLIKLDDVLNKSDSTTDKSIVKNASDSSKSIPKENSEKVGSKSAITFSEALKSIAMEDTMFQNQPKPLLPTTEISSDGISSSTSSLTLLQPLKNNSSSSAATADVENDNLGKKRTLPEGNSDSFKPDQKKIRILTADDMSSLSDSSDDKSEKDSSEENSQKEEDESAFKEASKNEDKNSHLSRPKEDDNNIKPMDKDDLQRKTVEEMQKANLSNAKLRRIKRRDLESLIIELFVDKVLYEHQLGQHKDLCKRLEGTLENNRKKAAQFHKEIEDLKKVTHRLQAEHLARKSHLVAPVKVKRSVGIQATPTIIGKGMMNVSSNSNIRVLSPSATSSSPSNPCNNNKTNLNQVSQQTALVNTSKTVNLSNQQPNPGASVMLPFVVQQPQNASQFIPVSTTRIVRTPLTPINSSSTQFATATVTGATVGTPISNTVSSSFIDLTDDDEAAKSQRASLQAGGLVAIQRTTAVGMNINQNPSGQFVALNPPSSVGQLLLVPSANGQPATALVVGSVANSNNTTSVVRTSIPQNSTVKITSPVGVVQSPRAIQMNGSSFVSQVPRHPAPLPRAPPQQTSGYSKKLPPLPTLKLSHKDNSIVLSWNMAKTDEHERIASYQIYAYQEGTAAPTPALWKKVGSVKALELPMACTLTQFMPGHVYHFAVRAVDIRSRLGPFSDPKSIRLGK